MSCVGRYDSLASLFTGAKEAKFPYLTKGKPASFWLIEILLNFLYKSSFCASNSYCFVLYLLHASAFITNHWCMRDAYILHPPPERLAHMTVSRSEKKSIYNILNKDIFLTKMHRFTTDGLYSPPEPCEAHFYYGCACFIWRILDGWTKTPIYSHSIPQKSKEQF